MKYFKIHVFDIVLFVLTLLASAQILLFGDLLDGLTYLLLIIVVIAFFNKNSRRFTLNLSTKHLKLISTITITLAMFDISDKVVGYPDKRLLPYAWIILSVMFHFYLIGILFKNHFKHLFFVAICIITLDLSVLKFPSYVLKQFVACVLIDERNQTQNIYFTKLEFEKAYAVRINRHPHTSYVVLEYSRENSNYYQTNTHGMLYYDTNSTGYLDMGTMDNQYPNASMLVQRISVTTLNIFMKIKYDYIVILDDKRKISS